MAKKSVVWTETALIQRREILKYWTLRNGNTKYAEKLLRMIKERVKVIRDYLFSGKVTNHTDTRQAAMGDFSIYYKVISNQIFITAFWDNRQDPGKLLEMITKLR